jgi:hypothetical protein
MPTPARIAQTEAPVSYVARIREHVQREEVGAARRVLAEALRAGADEPNLDHWAKVLAPAKVLGHSPASSTDRGDEVLWFEKNGREYRRQWVAVLGDELLAHAETYPELRAQLDRLKPAGRPLVHFIE